MIGRKFILISNFNVIACKSDSDKESWNQQLFTNQIHEVTNFFYQKGLTPSFNNTIPLTNLSEETIIAC